jgi:hypothetical protein
MHLFLFSHLTSRHGNDGQLPWIALLVLLEAVPYPPHRLCALV